jgi:DNA-binding CsgD family transcriptional regulator
MNQLTNNYGVPAINFEIDILTKREIEILRYAILPDKEVAYGLDMSYYTLLSHLKSIRQKTGLQDGKQLVYFGIKKGLIN